MKNLLLTLCTLTALGGSAFAGGYRYTLEDFNRDQDFRAFEAEDAANQRAKAADQRAQEIQDKLDEVEAQLEEQQQSQQEEAPAPQPLQPRVQTFADYTNADKAPRAQLVKLPR